jgi:DNA repair protein RadD
MALEDFKIGRIRALTSVDVLTTGYDEPGIDAIALLRPTQSPGLYYQMCGRGLRLHSEKKDCLVLDFAGNVLRHGPIDMIEIREPSTRNGSGEAPARECPDCARIVHTSVRVCPDCGHAFPEPEKAPILPEAALDPILSDEEAPVMWQEVGHVTYSLHVKEKGDIISSTLRVDYYGEEWKPIASEWVCLEHEGFARHKAEAWWARRDPEGREAPHVIDDAVEITDQLITPTEIATRREGKFLRVVDYVMQELVPLSAHSCSSCALWSEAKGECTMWNATPPEEVQAAGCEHHQYEDIPF